MLAAAGLILTLLVPSASAAGAPYPDELAAAAREKDLASSREWLVLLHHFDPWWGSPRSRADGRRFFLAPRGKYDPSAELAATLAAFFEEPREDEQHPQCRFPARYAWLKERLAFDPARLQERPCPRLKEWLETLDPGSATMVFADAYLNNPSSMYGHTFLRLDKRGRPDTERLLDYTINFAADNTGGSEVLFAVKGLMGGIPGVYSTMPYYMKAQEYNNLESRDLWEYRLSLSPKEIRDMMLHAWEMGSTHFGYFFFTENCSFQILALLETARPSLRLTEPFLFGVTPVDTLRTALAQGLGAGPPRWRPSHLTEMKARRARLTPQEMRMAARLGTNGYDDNDDGFRGLPPQRQAAVLESAHDLLRYRAGFTPELPPEPRRLERSLLVARGRLPAQPPPATFKTPTPPEKGHPTMRWGLGSGAGDKSAFQELSWRGALHDLSDDPTGYNPSSELQMLDVRLRHAPRIREVYLERLDLARILSLSPWDPWTRRRSWKVSGGLEQAKELDCLGWDCSVFDLNAGTGYAGRLPLAGGGLVFLLAEADLGLGPALRRDWRAGGGGTAGFALDLWRLGRLRLEASLIGYAAGDTRTNQRMRLVHALPLGRASALRIGLERSGVNREAGAALYYYY